MGKKAKEVLDKELQRAKLVYHSSTEAKISECSALLLS